MKKGDQVTARIESITHDGHGVARVNGKAVFVEGALPGETVVLAVSRQRKNHDLAYTVQILQASPDRVTPRCRFFGVCGGCSLQHLHDGAQLPSKEKILRDNLERIGKVEPDQWFAPLSSSYWGYRRKARLGVRYVEKKGGVIVGFRERNSSFITPLTDCDVLDSRVSRLLSPLHELIGGLSRPDRIPQVEVAVGDAQVAIVVRHLLPASPADDERLTNFARQFHVQLFRQPGAPNELVNVWPSNPEPLYYELPDHQCRLEFTPTDFVQVNAELNRVMVNRALEFLELTREDRVLDLFCGLGNFTLPIARQAKDVVGIDMDAALVSKACHNARLNSIDNTEFRQSNLYNPESPDRWERERFDKCLIDPPRTGAVEVVRRLPDRGGPARLVYVSCNPATLARDAGVLVHDKGYRLANVGVMDMFPQTSHVEAMALFVRAE